MDPILDAHSKLRIAEREAGDVIVLALSGDMLVDDGDAMFRRKIHDLIDHGRLRIVVDLGGLASIDSSGVGMMVAKLNAVRAHGGDMKLARPSGRSVRLLATMKILDVFEVFDDEDAAVRSFASS